MSIPYQLSYDPTVPICSSGKRPFRTRGEAEHRLAQVRRQRSLTPTATATPDVIRRVRIYSVLLVVPPHIGHTPAFAAASGATELHLLMDGRA